jgi:hypothetical protein
MDRAHHYRHGKAGAASVEQGDPRGNVLLAISVLNQETSKKRSLKQKAKRASMSPDYMLSVLAAALVT